MTPKISVGLVFNTINGTYKITRIEAEKVTCTNVSDDEVTLTMSVETLQEKFKLGEAKLLGE